MNCRTRLLAAALSFAVPGLGHVLVNAPLRAVIWLIGFIVVVAAGGWGESVAVLALMGTAGIDAYVMGGRNEAAPPRPPHGGRPADDVHHPSRP